MLMAEILSAGSYCFVELLESAKAKEGSFNNRDFIVSVNNLTTDFFFS